MPWCPVQSLVCDVSELCLYKNSDLLVAVRFRFTLYAPLVPDQEQPTPPRPTSGEQLCQTRMKWMRSCDGERTIRNIPGEGRTFSLDCDPEVQFPELTDRGCRHGLVRLEAAPGSLFVASNSEMVRNCEGKLCEDSEACSGH